MARTERPPNSARPAALTESSGFLLNKAAQRAVALGEEALQAFGVKPRHYGVLEAVSDAGPRSQQQIGHLLQIDRTTMAAVADDLERLGLAIRQPYPGNRRANALHLTDAAAALLPRLRAAIGAAESQLLEPLDASERQRLHSLLLLIAPD
jgi:DNA-binding MarR family transcriptional regulator